MGAERNNTDVERLLDLQAGLVTDQFTAYADYEIEHLLEAVGAPVASMPSSSGLLNTSDHRVLMPAVVLLGAALALAADLVTHLPWTRQFLHLNTVTSMIGAPVVLWLVLRRRHLRGLEL